LSKIALLIDGGYFDKVKYRFAKDVYGGTIPRIDLELLSNNICMKIDKEGARYRTYYYDALPWAGNPPAIQDIDRRTRKQSFLDKIKLLRRFEVRYGRLQKIDSNCSQCGSPKTTFNQKLVDVLISVDMCQLAWSKNVDTIAILTGDSDFTPEVKSSKEAGAMIYLVYDPGTYIHDELKLICDDRLVIDRDLIDSSILSSP